MLIALLRHADAEESVMNDRARRLTSRGRQNLSKLLDFLSSSAWKPGIILTSPYLRTLQTAEQVAERYPHVPMITTDLLASSSHEGFQWLAADHPNPLLVGHEPTLGMFGAQLLGAPAHALPVEKAGFFLFEVDRLPTTRPARLLLSVSPRWL